MSLEAKIELLTAAVIELTAAIGAMQAPGQTEVKIYPNDPADGQTGKSAGKSAATEKVSSSEAADTGNTEESRDQQPPAGESSSNEMTLDYAKDVKPITIRLSKEKGREITIGVLSRFGVKSAQDLDAGQWADYIAHCEKVLAGGEV